MILKGVPLSKLYRGMDKAGKCAFRGILIVFVVNIPLYVLNTARMPLILRGTFLTGLEKCIGSVYCHSERSEGSRCPSRQRPYAEFTLSVTNVLSVTSEAVK
jgi:hypothetical protein